MSGVGEIDGFYAIYYHGETAPGLAQIQLTNGYIVGADVAGGIWDGSYALNPAAGVIACEITIRLPPGTALATTGKPPNEGQAAGMRFDLPLDFISKPFIPLDLPIGRVNVRFQKLR